MKDHVANPNFQQKRILEIRLESQMPEAYFSKYSMVTFKEDMGYNEAMVLGRAQDKSILKMIEKKQINLNSPIEELYEKIKGETDLLKNQRI